MIFILGFIRLMQDFELHGTFLVHFDNVPMSSFSWLSMSNNFLAYTLDFNWLWNLCFNVFYSFVWRLSRWLQIIWCSGRSQYGLFLHLTLNGHQQFSPNDMYVILVCSTPPNVIKIFILRAVAGAYMHSYSSLVFRWPKLLTDTEYSKTS